MKTIYVALFCAAVVVLSVSQQAQALDEVDRLVLGDSIAATTDESASDHQEPVVVVSSEIAGGEISSYVDAPAWQRDEMHEPLNAQSSGSPGGHLADEKTSSTFAVSIVPEPSAIALAGVALIYFLLFGRRRQWS